MPSISSKWHRFCANSSSTTKECRPAHALHDVVEDTYIGIDAIRREFGLRVAELVLGVTDECGADQQERRARTYPKIAADEDRVILKLADRIANVRAAIVPNNDADTEARRLLEMYRNEYQAFHDALFRAEHFRARATWNELERLMKQ